MSNTEDILRKFKEKQGGGSTEKRVTIPPVSSDSGPRRSFSAPKTSKGSTDAWVVMYGDMMSTLLIFFILLYSMSSVNKARFTEALESVQNAISGKADPSSREKDVPHLSQVFQEISALVKKEDLTTSLQIGKSANGIVISVGDQVLFGPGNAELTQDAKVILSKIAKVLASVDYPMEVSGHTDNIPVKSKVFDSNWELSTARACSVVKYLIDFANIDPKRLVAKGYSAYKPLVPNISKANRAKNRRIEILILRAG